MTCNATMIGRFSKDVECITAKTGTSVLFNTVAFDNRKQNGEKTTSWFDITAFGKTAELLERFHNKGSKVALTGRVEIHEYDYEKDGVRKQGRSPKFFVESFEIIDSRKPKDGIDDNSGDAPF